MTIDVLVVAGTGIDTTVTVDALPVSLSDSVGVPPIRDWVAHTGNGYALGLHTLGLATTFIDMIGDDPQAELITAAYRRHGLHFDHRVSPAGTPRAVNLVDATGRRQSFFDGRHPAELRMPEDLYQPYLDRARHVHMSIMNINRDMYDASGASSSTDLHDWDGHNPHHEHYALRSELVFLSAAALGDRRDAVMRRILTDGRAHTVVATDGGNGCFVAREATPVTHFPAIRPDRDLAGLDGWQGWSSVDSNGAGDAFGSGFLSHHLAGAPLEECVTAGMVAGAFACRSAGTHTEFIDAGTLRRACDALR
ncbi:carbohydrate kinase family protein [Stackebrandtia nassauensis]|uniref:PfkB domain protein n=1 Tax=Stackebrandtia nassauensis (strain DSM 44728 / CIP 108903 / NRRL B-16338 / NBRC 102104 / LLR-40K-21) TaxID=446470 RepID=D3Q3U9_STANL|nr:PfkB family carbohydrate kinase [Stackebrandtia nassauensis]ADD44016.1 PfkB domain protein [Stackebrandtia nassauensis DSM 44728]